VFIEPSAMLYLLGTHVDYEVTKLRSGFVFKNPNEVSACGCGESVELRPRRGRHSRLIEKRARLAARLVSSVELEGSWQAAPASSGVLFLLIVHIKLG
jgi:hypothetical protein